MSECWHVYQRWIQIGWVKWQGSPVKEKMMMIEYVRCDGCCRE